jgi:hypothetical protein
MPAHFGGTGVDRTRSAAAPRTAAARSAAGTAGARRPRRTAPDLLWSDDELRRAGTAGPHSYGMIVLLLGIPAVIATVVLGVLFWT